MTETPDNNAVEILDNSYEGSAVSREIQNLASGNAAFYSTMVGNDFDTKVATVDAMTNSLPIKANLGKTINVENVIVQSVSFANRSTGEMQDVARLVLLDKDGTAYHAMSGGLWRSVQNILGVMGHPSTWPAPLPIHIVEVKGRDGDFYTAKIGAAPKSK